MGLLPQGGDSWTQLQVLPVNDQIKAHDPSTKAFTAQLMPTALNGTCLGLLFSKALVSLAGSLCLNVAINAACSVGSPGARCVRQSSIFSY